MNIEFTKRHIARYVCSHKPKWKYKGDRYEQLTTKTSSLAGGIRNHVLGHIHEFEFFEVEDYPPEEYFFRHVELAYRSLDTIMATISRSVQSTKPSYENMLKVFREMNIGAKIGVVPGEHRKLAGDCAKMCDSLESIATWYEQGQSLSTLHPDMPRMLEAIRKHLEYSNMLFTANTWLDHLAIWLKA